MNLLLIGFSADEEALFTFSLQQRQITTVGVKKVGDVCANWSRLVADGILLNSKQPGGLIAALRRCTNVPIFILTERLCDEADELAWLDEGATFVFNRTVTSRRLAAQIAALLRSAVSASVQVLDPISSGDVYLDPATRTVRRGSDGKQRLTNREFRLLHVLMRHTGRLVTNEQLLKEVWGYDEEDGGLVRNVIYHLRRKLEPRADQFHYIHTVPGVGYQFSADSSEMKSRQLSAESDNAATS